MTEKTYPRKAWVLMPSFKPVEISVVKEDRIPSYDISEKGKSYHISDLFETKEAAIEAGYFKCQIDEYKILKIQAKVYNRRQALKLASVK